jgi:hypothetical protein
LVNVLPYETWVVYREWLFSAAEALRVCGFGCWVAAFRSRGPVRISPWIVPYAAAGLGISYLQWSPSLVSMLAVAGTLTLVIAAWTALELAGRNYAGARWAVWGTLLWFGSVGAWWLGITFSSEPGPLPLAYRAVQSLAVDFAAWLIAMSVRSAEPAEAVAAERTQSV